jgi:hypothetical protein
MELHINRKPRTRIILWLPVVEAISPTQRTRSSWRRSIDARAGPKVPLSNASNILHIKTELNVSHGTPPKK